MTNFLVFAILCLNFSGIKSQNDDGNSEESNVVTERFVVLWSHAYMCNESFLEILSFFRTFYELLELFRGFLTLWPFIEIFELFLSLLRFFELFELLCCTCDNKCGGIWSKNMHGSFHKWSSVIIHIVSFSEMWKAMKKMWKEFLKICLVVQTDGT